jgi:hypothetical protein
MAPHTARRSHAGALHRAECLCRLNHVGGNDTRLDDGLVVIDVVDEPIQREDALLETAFDRVPLRGRHDPRHEVEREDALGTRAVTVDVERDAHLHQRAFGRTLTTEQLAVGQRVDELDQRARERSGHAARFEHLVKEPTRLVLDEPHVNSRLRLLLISNGRDDYVHECGIAVEVRQECRVRRRERVRRRRARSGASRSRDRRGRTGSRRAHRASDSGC